MSKNSIILFSIFFTIILFLPTTVFSRTSYKFIGSSNVNPQPTQRGIGILGTPVTGYKVGIYWDIGCTQRVESIDWGTLYAGGSSSRVVYLRNEGTGGFTLYETTKNYNPTWFAPYINVTWNYNGQAVYPNQVVQVTLNLKLDISVFDEIIRRGLQEPIYFGFDLIITMRPYDSDVSSMYPTGMNYNVKGTCVDYNGQHTDVCWGLFDPIKGTVVHEWYINDEKCSDTYYACNAEWWNPSIISCYDGKCLPSRGSGCPVLKVWVDNKLTTIEKLNIHSPKDQDTVATSTFNMQPVNGKYEIVLDEAAYLFWDGSHIDFVRLTDETGKECKLISATHSKDGDILSAIAKSDDVRVRSYPGDRIKLVYDSCTGNQFSFSIEGYNRKCGPMGCEILGLTNYNLIIILLTLVIMIVIIYGGFKYFSNKK